MEASMNPEMRKQLHEGCGRPDLGSQTPRTATELTSFTCCNVHKLSEVRDRVLTGVRGVFEKYTYRRYASPCSHGLPISVLHGVKHGLRKANGPVPVWSDDTQRRKGPLHKSMRQLQSFAASTLRGSVGAWQPPPSCERLLPGARGQRCDEAARSPASFSADGACTASQCPPQQRS